MDEISNIIDDNGFDAELEIIDLLISDASKAIDAGDFNAALEGFREALVLIRRIFGESQEIAQLNSSVDEIGMLLGE